MADKFEKIYCNKLIEHMEAGLSFSSFAGVVGVTRLTLDRWRKRYPEFEDAYQKGKYKSMIFWENLGIHGAAGELPKFNAASWIFNMKNRFDWRDKKEIDNKSSDGSMSPVNLDLNKLSTEQLESLLEMSEKVYETEDNKRPAEQERDKKGIIQAENID